MIAWLKSRGVALKTEEDGRIFPLTDSSQTIIDCLLQEAEKVGVDIRLKQKVERIEKEAASFKIYLQEGECLECDKILLATGSSPQGFQLAAGLGHTIIPPVPSLFTFNIPHFTLQDLAGISVEKAQIKITDSNLQQTGPLLITHWGFSGPAALKLSAWGARLLHEKNYQVTLQVNWLSHLTREQLVGALKEIRSAQTLHRGETFGLARNLWIKLIEDSGVDLKKRWLELSHKEIFRIAEKLQADFYKVEGKTTYKSEFVTCGGIPLDEVNFKTMESKKCPGLYFAGEILDIDGVTGGFNFQSAWTTSWIAGHAMGETK